MELLEFINMEILNIAIGLVLLMIANILLGSIDAWLNQQFDRKKLIQGIIKAIVVAISMALVYIAGILNTDVIVVDINGEIVDLITGVNLVLTLGALYYAKEVFVKLVTFIKGKINIGDNL